MAKYTDAAGITLIASTTTAKVGLLRLGELMAGQFAEHTDVNYWTLTPISTGAVWSIVNTGLYDVYEIKPALNLKSNVIITSGTGTKEDPFIIALSE